MSHEYIRQFIFATTPSSKSKHKPRTKPPARSTLHDEIVMLRMVLKTAIRHGWLQYLPDLSPPYKSQGKVVHRLWCSPEEYKQLYEAARAYAKEPFNGRFKWNAAGLRLHPVHGEHGAAPR
jgi:hypothetical protein